MAVSVRMDAVLESELGAAAGRAGITKSQFIIEAVERALGRKDAFSALLQVHSKYGIGRDGDGDGQGDGSGANVLREPTPKPLTAQPPSAAAYRADLVAKHEADLRDWQAFHDARARGDVWSPEPRSPGPQA